MRTRLLALAFLLTATVLTAGEHSMSYIYKRGEASYTRISGTEIERIGEVSRKYGSEFVWVRVSGSRKYVIRDAATLAEVRAAFAQVDAMASTFRDAERRMKPYEVDMQKIEERVDSLGDSLDDESLSEAARRSIEDKLHDAESDMHAIEDKMHDVESELNRLERENERRERVAEDRFEEIVERAISRGVAERVQ